MFEKKERSGKFDLGKESKRKASSGGQYDKGNHEQEKKENQNKGRGQYDRGNIGKECKNSGQHDKEKDEDEKKESKGGGQYDRRRQDKV